MHDDKARASVKWRTFRRTVVRALLLGPTLAAVGGLFGLICGGVLSLADGLPWAFAGGWGLRGAFAGLVAGAIIGALCGISHVDEPASRPAPVAPKKSITVNGASRRTRPAVTPERNGARGAYPPTFVDHKED